MIDDIATWLCFIGVALALFCIFLMLIGLVLFGFDM